jgi:indolepyruvate ferredoxin oxidoreductase alpha subunit
MGDIGCYTLGALPPVVALDTCLCMGASIGMMAGFNRALGRKAAVGVIGDSTFFHSGITALIDALYNQAEGLVMVLDNGTTAMTGHQGHPGTGLHAQGTHGAPAEIQRLCEGIGVRCETVDANDYTALERSIRDEIDMPGLGVVVALAPCVLAVRDVRGAILVDEDRCNLCGVCLKLGCPALVPGETSISIAASCTGCALCVEVCRRGALSFVAASPDDAGCAG